MEHSPEAIKKHVRGYLIIGSILYVFTLITVAVSYLDLSVPASILLALFIATIKGSLVCLFFMHLISEKDLVFWSLVITVVLFLLLMVLPIATSLDPIQILIKVEH